MTVGECVELCMMPGDEAPRVARLQALWSQAAMDGCERMFAQCCYFYRPSVRLHAACSHRILELQTTGRCKLPCRCMAHAHCSSLQCALYCIGR